MKVTLNLKNYKEFTSITARDAWASPPLGALAIVTENQKTTLYIRTTNGWFNPLADVEAFLANIPTNGRDQRL